MATDTSRARGASEEPPPDDDDVTAFVNVLNELKATGCTLLVAGDATRDAFTRASGQLFGDDDVLRYRVLAVTDATPRSVADRLPESRATPRPLPETTRLLSHAGAPRSITSDSDSAVPSDLARVRETRISDPELRGMQSELVDAIAAVAAEADKLGPADLRVGVDSLTPLVDHHGADVVRRCLDAVGGHVRKHDGMAHYVVTDEYDSERVQRLLPSADAVVELRSVDPDEYGHGAQQRWHVPERDITTDWTPL